MSSTGAKKRSSRVPTSGLVSSGSSHKVKKPPGSAKLSSNGVVLKGSRFGQVVRQFNSIDTDGEASKGEGVFDSKMNTPQAKHFNNGAIVGSSLSSINFDIEEKEEVFLLPRKTFSLDKVWIDSKIIKTQVEVAVKKSFALDVNLSAVEGKSATAKTHAIRKLFSKINGFGEATTPSKFEGIIRSIFISEASMKKAVSLARENNIIVNSDLKRQRICSDWALVIKEIPMDTPKEMIVAAVSKFGEIKSIKIQLISLWQKTVVEFAELEQAVFLTARWSFLIGKDSVCVTMVVSNHETWVSRNQFKALLFTLPMGTTAHDLGDLLEGAGGKTCVINWLLETGNRVCCAVVCFDSNEILESAFCTEPILGSMKLSWARLDLVHCEQCRKFGHSALECDAELAKLYVKKNVPISYPVAFGGKSWAQVVSVASVSHGFRAGFGSSSPPSGDLSSGGVLPLLPVFPTSVSLVVANSDLDFDMAVDDPFVQPTSFSPGVTSSLLSPSSSKVLTSKVGGLESKLVALNISIGSILVKLDQLCAGLGSSVISLSQ
ncbi:hypothetical protein G9A89_015484 [Geosiphon pyriformis]|nr:hypothetical protein G9A89_015484 [Geosiphon pyriformis]